MAYKSSLRGARPVTLVAIHTAEGARTARSLAAYFFREDIFASSHSIIDARGILHIVPFSRASWTLRSGNPISDNLEICGFARWTRQQWLSTGTVDGCVNPRQMLRWVSAWIRLRCAARNIPIRKLSVSQVRAGLAGVIAHDDWTKAFRDGTHWDPGPGFPWDVVIADASGGGSGDMPLDAADIAKIDKVVNQRCDESVRYLGHGDIKEAFNDPSVRPTNNTIGRVLERLDALEELMKDVPTGESLRLVIREEMAGKFSLTPAREDPELPDPQ